MSLYYRYTLTEGAYPDSFVKSVYFANIAVSVSYYWPFYIEEEINNINEALNTRMKSMGLEDGTQTYDYLTYWSGVKEYLTTHTVQQWVEDDTQVHPQNIIGKDLSFQEDFVDEELDFYDDAVTMLDFYNEMLVWSISITYNGMTINCPLQLGGWTEFPDGSFSFRFASKHKDKIGKNDLYLFDIHFEVPEGGVNA